MRLALATTALLALAACDSGPRCNADSCPGCCDAHDVCQAGDQAKVCGKGGQLCVLCPKSDVCNAGVCESAPCGPDTCTGCCDAQGRCAVSAIDSACGLNGVACVQCSVNQRCSAGSCITCLTSGANCSSDTSCCSQLCDGLTGFTPGSCH